MLDITNDVQRFISENDVSSGAVIVYCPHTTAGITINENADPDVKRDMLRRFVRKHGADGYVLLVRAARKIVSSNILKPRDFGENNQAEQWRTVANA